MCKKHRHSLAYIGGDKYGNNYHCWIEWHVLSLFPGDAQLKVARQGSIQKSIDSLSDLAPHLEESLNAEITAVDSFWNKGSTLDVRKRNLQSKCLTAASTIEHTARQSTEHVTQSEDSLLEHDKPTRLYLQFENRALISARQAS